MKLRVLVTARSFSSTSPAPANILRNAGYEVLHRPMLDEMSLIAALHGVHGWIVGTNEVTARIIESSPNLRVIVKHGVGVDNIAVDSARERGIVVANTPDANSEAVAELTIGLMLAVSRNIVQADKQARQKTFSPIIGGELYGKILGVIGLGRIGKLVVKRVAGFEMKILAFDPVHDDEFGRRHRVLYVPLNELLSNADVVTLHLPLQENTRGIINRERLALLKSSSSLINTARAELIHEAALIDALHAGQISGAGLDVFSYSEDSGSLLLSMNNVVLTPHIGAHTMEAITAMSTMAAETLVAALEGRHVVHRVA